MKSKIVLALLLMCCCTLIYAQKNISGTVFDSQTNETLIGANVVVTNTTTGTSTDVNGAFSFSIPNDAKRLEISYIGYETQTIEIGNRSNFSIALKSASILDEVVVIGYGTQKKSDKTGAVTQVKSDELNVGRLSDPIQALQGKAAGVVVSKKGGDPNEGFSVNIRGASSFTANTDPLFVVDGVVDVDPTTINQDDIESYNVLKDASSTAIYGAKGSNGVVIITTKSSGLSNSKASNQVEFSSNISFDQVARKLDFLTADEVRDYATTSGASFVDNGANTDWQDEIFRSGVSTQNNLAFSGNAQGLSYRASLSANNITGSLLGSAKDRYIGRLNLAKSLFNNRLNIYGRLSTTIEENTYVNYGNGSSPTNVIYQAFRRIPTDPVRNEDGTFFETDRSFQYYNPVAIIENIENTRNAKRTFGNFKAELEIIKGLTISSNLAYTVDDAESNYAEKFETVFNQEGLARRKYENEDSRLSETVLNYSKNFDVHNINVIVGHSYQVIHNNGFEVSGRDLSTNTLLSSNLQQFIDPIQSEIKSYDNNEKFASFFGRAIYDFDSKYYITATLRRDGSSKFGENNKWGTFPAISASWDLIKDGFLNNLSFLSLLKLRAGYGIVGNQAIPRKINKQYYAPTGTAINPENGETVVVYEIEGDIKANPDLQWEQAKEVNIGLDFGLFNDKISSSIEFYDRRTTDLIYKFGIPVPPNKQPFIYANAAEAKNTGLEASFNAFPVNRKNLFWKTILTFSTNKQKIISLGNDLYDLAESKELFVEGRGFVGGETHTQIVRPDFPLGTFFIAELLDIDGGEFRYYTEQDPNSAAIGATRDVTKAERRDLGNAQPKFSIGWSNFLNFGNSLDASIAMRAVIGHKIYNSTKMFFGNPGDLPTLNVLQTALEEKENGLVSAPAINSYYLEDGSFLKVDNVNVGYNFNIKNANFIDRLRFDITANNLLTITKYTGLDPEVAYGGVAFGMEQYDLYPKTRSITLGLRAIFK